MQTREDAIHNKMSFLPSPAELSESFLAGEQVKPIRVRRLSVEQDTGTAFELVEGKLRYWGWALAFGEDAEIPALIREG